MSQQGALETPPSPPPPLLAAPRENLLQPQVPAVREGSQLWILPTQNTSPSCSSNSPVDLSPQCPLIKDEDSELLKLPSSDSKVALLWLHWDT